MSESSSIQAIQFDLTNKPFNIYNPVTGQDESVMPHGTMYTVQGVTDPDGNLRKMSIGELVMVLCLARATEMEAYIIALMDEMSENTDVLNQLTDIDQQLVDGKQLADIKGTFKYRGQTFNNAETFLYAVGVFDENLTDEKLNQFITLNNLSNLFANGTMPNTVTGPFTWNGTSYWDILSFMNAVDNDVFNHPGGTTFSNKYGALMPLLDEILRGEASINARSALYNLNLISLGELMFMTAQELQTRTQQQLPKLFMNDFNNLALTLAGITNLSQDDIISKVESKMDSLNSFSQEKMIELQSYTNKRDQAYDMITNILKSLNTTLVGISNNM